jgi:hypothetical protein
MEEQIEQLKKANIALTEQHAKVSGALSNKIQQLESATHMHVAEKDALGQSVQELMQNNVRLRATCILLEKQLNATAAQKDEEIKQLSAQLNVKNKDLEVKSAEMANLNAELIKLKGNFEEDDAA